ncbi:MAG TPA: GspH/FimT family pseudopilin [Longimicrobium sp.]|nr:GspH/FimT family pseudopilin [Longimicrobium sp.]
MARKNGSRRGFSLTEVMVALAVFGILMALAAPRFEGALAHIRSRGALNRVAGHLMYTRHLAVRTGGRAWLEIEPSEDCPSPRNGAAGYRYRVKVWPDSQVVLVNLRLDGAPVCLASNQSSDVVFNSRGLLVGFNNRTMSVSQGNHPPVSLTVSAVGRVLRN